MIHEGDFSFLIFVKVYFAYIVSLILFQESKTYGTAVN